MKGGHNGENHNHNDVGSFLLYLNGEPGILDAGNVVYTAKTFSSERYTLWNTRSRNHNVALIAGCEQGAGAEFRAVDVIMDEESASMELKHCYPVECGLKSYVRHAVLHQDGFRLHDRISMVCPAPVEWVFLLREEPSIQPGVCNAGALRLCFSPELQCEAEAYPVTDARMKQKPIP